MFSVPACSTKSFNFVPQTKECKELAIKCGIKLGKKSNFRNCYAIHYGEKGSKVCVKIYSNGTTQINGVLNVEKAIEYVKKCIQDGPLSFKINCSFSNWTVTFEKKNLDLEKTMKALNDNGILSYFQQGISLIIKHSAVLDTNDYFFSDNGLDLETSVKETTIKITLLLFSSGKCISISSLSEHVYLPLIRKLDLLLVVADC